MSKKAFLEQLKKWNELSYNEREDLQTAIHETGHAFVHEMLYPGQPYVANVIGQELAEEYGLDIVGITRFESSEDASELIQYLKGMMVAVGGKAACLLYFPNELITGLERDIKMAGRFARSVLEKNLRVLPYYLDESESKRSKKIKSDDVYTLYRKVGELTSKYIRKNKDALEELIEIIYQDKALVHSDTEKIHMEKLAAPDDKELLDLLPELAKEPNMDKVMNATMIHQAGHLTILSVIYGVGYLKKAHRLHKWPITSAGLIYNSYIYDPMKREWTKSGGLISSSFVEDTIPAIIDVAGIVAERLYADKVYNKEESGLKSFDFLYESFYRSRGMIPARDAMIKKDRDSLARVLKKDRKLVEIFAEKILKENEEFLFGLIKACDENQNIKEDDIEKLYEKVNKNAAREYCRMMYDYANDPVGFISKRTRFLKNYEK